MKRFLRAPVARRVGLAVALAFVFAVGFGGSFTCTGQNGSVTYTDPNRRK